MASVGSILSGAFRLFRDKPMTVAVWGLIFLAISAVSYLPYYSTTQTIDLAPVEPPSIGAAIGIGAVAIVVTLAYTSVMMCAVFRAILRPDESSFASIRLGMDELRMMGLYIILTIAVIFGWLIVMLVGVMLVGGSAAATGSAGFTVLMMILIYLGMLGGVIFVAVRLSLVFALSFVRRRIAIDDAWALTRGRFWMLFLVYLVLVVLAIILYTVVLGPFMQPYFAEMMRAFQNPAAMESAQATELARMANVPLTTTILMTVASAVVQTILHTVNGGATATAVRELLLEQGEVLDDDVERTAQIFE